MRNVNSFLFMLGTVITCYGQTSHLMRLDTANFKYKCNDYHDRLTININFLNNSNSSSLYTLKYQSNEMPSSTNFSSFQARNLTLKSIIDSYYSYKLIIQAADELEPTCDFNFIHFGHCDIAQIVISEHNCTISVEPYKRFSIVPFIYLTVGIIFAITIILKFGKKFFTRYKHV